MSIDKWRVRKLVYPDGCPGTYPWHVIPPGLPTPRDPLEAYRFNDERITAWRTHRMALTEALYEIKKGVPMNYSSRGEDVIEIVDTMGNRYPVFIDTLEDFYRGDIEAYVQEEIVPQYEWWIEP